MKPIDFPQANCELGAPEGQESFVYSIKAFKYQHKKDGLISYTTMWQPSEEDIKNINEGRPIVLMQINGFCPVSIWTENEGIEIFPF